MAYVDLASLKSYLGNTTSTDDALLTALIARAQKTIDSYTRRTFEASSDTTKYLDAVYPYVNGRWLYLSEVGDICAITSITNGNSTSVSASSYVTEPRNIVANSEPIRALKLKDNASIAWTYTGTPEAAITVVGRWAYSTSAPADIVQACVRLAAFMYRQKDNSADVDRPLLAGDGNVVMPTALPRDVDVILRPYRRLI